MKISTRLIITLTISVALPASGLSRGFKNSNPPRMLFCVAMAPSDQKFSRYCNDRFGFCVSFPDDLSLDRPPMNGDGQRFHDGNGFALSVSGINDDSSLDAEMDLCTGDFDGVTYRATGKNWFVLSGRKGNNILYVKTFVGTRSINHLYIQYPTRLKSRYDQIVKKISDSFKPGRLNIAG